MSGYTTNGLPALGLLTGVETMPADTNNTQGIAPESGAISLMQLATLVKQLGNSADKTTVAGSRYASTVQVGAAITVTGIQALIGSVGGTDKWLVELHDSTGALVATSALAGATVGTAAALQKFDFTAPVTIQPGTYSLVVQANGTTAKLATYNAPSLPLFTSSATGTFGTSASMALPTTYTANLGPVANLY